MFKPDNKKGFQQNAETLTLMSGEYRGRTDDLLHAMQAL